MTIRTLNHEWLATLEAIVDEGYEKSPRGKLTREIKQHTVKVDMLYPVLSIPERRLSYKFMAAEAHWILSGSNKVVEIAPWNQRMAEYSDDGETLFGAYGPRILSQLDYVVSKLKEDGSTRQAGLTIWRENPATTKDVPCTIAIFASLANRQLDLSVFMRSSDAWLGLPYDVFSFSMLAHLICCRLNATHMSVTPGRLYLTAASSHLYSENWQPASDISKAYHPFSKAIRNNLLVNAPVPLVLSTDENALMLFLDNIRNGAQDSSYRWWQEGNHAPRS